MNAVERWKALTNGESLSVSQVIEAGDLLARELEQVIQACEACNSNCGKSSPSRTNETKADG